MLSSQKRERQGKMEGEGQGCMNKQKKEADGQTVKKILNLLFGQAKNNVNKPTNPFVDRAHFL
jgi:hypothetical protein